MSISELELLCFEYSSHQNNLPYSPEINLFGNATKLFCEMPLLNAEELKLLEQQVVHCFAVLAFRAKCELSLLKWSFVYISMDTICLKLSLGSAIAFLVLALTLLVACLIKESGNLCTIQEQLLDIVRHTPLETMNNLVDEQ